MLVELKKGMKVNIMNQTIDGRNIEEGKATLCKLITKSPRRELWEVVFDDEPRCRYHRFVADVNIID